MNIYALSDGDLVIIYLSDLKSNKLDCFSEVRFFHFFISDKYKLCLTFLYPHLIYSFLMNFCKVTLRYVLF